MFIRNRNEPHLSLPSQPQLVLIYWPQRDGRLSRPWCEVAQAEMQACNLPIANPALYHTATAHQSQRQYCINFQVCYLPAVLLSTLAEQLQRDKCKMIVSKRTKFLYTRWLRGTLVWDWIKSKRSKFKVTQLESERQLTVIKGRDRMLLTSRLFRECPFIDTRENWYRKNTGRNIK